MLFNRLLFSAAIATFILTGAAFASKEGHDDDEGFRGLPSKSSSLSNYLDEEEEKPNLQTLIEHISQTVIDTEVFDESDPEKSRRQLFKEYVEIIKESEWKEETLKTLADIINTDRNDPSVLLVYLKGGSRAPQFLSSLKLYQRFVDHGFTSARQCADLLKCLVDTIPAGEHGNFYGAFKAINFELIALEGESPFSKQSALRTLIYNFYSIWQRSGQNWDQVLALVEKANQFFAGQIVSLRDYNSKLWKLSEKSETAYSMALSNK